MIPGWLSTAAGRLLTAPDDAAVARRLVAADTAMALLDLARLIGEAAEPVAAIDALADSDGTAASLVAELVIQAFASVRLDLPAQPDAVAARGALSERAGAAYAAIGEAFGHEALDFAVRLAGEAMAQLSRIAATRAPLVRVESGISLPSSLAAFDLYGDPGRGEEIAARNRCGTAMLLPARFVALAV